VTKRKPDSVQEIRISLQDKLTQQVDDFLLADQVKNYADSLDKLLTLENLIVAATVIEIYTGREILLGTPNDIPELMKMFKDAFKLAPLEERERRATSFTGGLQNLLDLLFAATTGNIPRPTFSRAEA
jgi:hypothetical protein